MGFLKYIFFPQYAVLSGFSNFLIGSVYFFKKSPTWVVFILSAFFFVKALPLVIDFTVPELGYRIYLRQAATEGDKIAQEFLQEMNNKSEFVIYSTLKDRELSNHKKYGPLFTRIEIMKDNDKNRKSTWGVFKKAAVVMFPID